MSLLIVVRAPADLMDAPWLRLLAEKILPEQVAKMAGLDDLGVTDPRPVHVRLVPARTADLTPPQFAVTIPEIFGAEVATNRDHTPADRTLARTVRVVVDTLGGANIPDYVLCDIHGITPQEDGSSS